MTRQNFSTQIPKNLAINILSFIATVGIGLWLTPYLLKHLGIAAYGLIPLAMFLSQYVSVIINAINMSINRFLLIALQKNDDKNANEIFNTALVIIFIFIVLQALIMGVVLFDITLFFTIPQELVFDAVWLFGLTFLGFSISLFRSVFGTSMFAYNRLDILRMIDIGQNVVRVVSIVVLFSYDEPSLKYIGVANLLASLCAVLPTLYYFKKFTPQLRVTMHFFSKHRVSELSKMSTWVLINQVGVLLLGNIDLYLVNIWLGTQATGEYAIVLQFTSIFRTFLTLLAGVLTPVIMICYANNEHEKLKSFLVLSVKMMIIALIFPLALIVGISENILSLWLGSQYSYLHQIISSSMLFYVIAIPVSVLYNITLSYNKMKLPALWTIILGAISIMSIYLLTSYTDLALWSIVGMKLLIEIVFSIFLILYVSHILDKSPWKWFLMSLFTIVYFIIMISIIYFIKVYLPLDNWADIGLFCLGLSIIIYPSSFFILFSREERNLLYQKMILERKKDA